MNIGLPPGHPWMKAYYGLGYGRKPEWKLDWTGMLTNLPDNYVIDIKKWEDGILGREKEQAWFEKNFPTIIVSDECRKDAIYAVNFQGIVDDMMLRHLSYEKAIFRNSAVATGVFTK